MLQRFGVAAGIAFVCIAPWVFWAPGPFWEGNVQWFNDLDRFPRMKWDTEHTWTQITGFSGLFWARGWERWLKPIQLSVVLFVTMLYWVRGASAAGLLPCATAVFLLFMVFNPVLWPYLYNPALVTALLAVAGSGLVGRRSDSRARIDRRE